MRRGSAGWKRRPSPVAELAGEVDDHVDADRRPDADPPVVGDRHDRGARDRLAGEEVHVGDLRLPALARVGGEEAGRAAPRRGQVDGDRFDRRVVDVDHDRVIGRSRPVSRVSTRRTPSTGVKTRATVGDEGSLQVDDDVTRGLGVHAQLAVVGEGHDRHRAARDAGSVVHARHVAAGPVARVRAEEAAGGRCRRSSGSPRPPWCLSGRAGHVDGERLAGGQSPRWVLTGVDDPASGSAARTRSVRRAPGSGASPPTRVAFARSAVNASAMSTERSPVPLRREVRVVARVVAELVHHGRPVPREERPGRSVATRSSAGSRRRRMVLEHGMRVIFGHQIRWPGPITSTRCMIALVGARLVPAQTAESFAPRLTSRFRVPSLGAPGLDPVRRPGGRRRPESSGVVADPGTNPDRAPTGRDEVGVERGAPR
jgi:hypothetical protein